MAKTGTITMSMKEAYRLKIIAAVVDGNLKPNQAAERLELTTRQVRRLVLRYEAEGAAGLVSQRIHPDMLVKACLDNSAL